MEPIKENSEIDGLLEYLDTRSDLQKLLMEKQEAFRQFVTSEGYDVWNKCAEGFEAHLRHKAALGDTLEERQEAHFTLKALISIRMLPLEMAEQIREMNKSEPETPET